VGPTDEGAPPILQIQRNPEGTSKMKAVIKDVVAGLFPLSPSCGRRMKEPVQMVSGGVSNYHLLHVHPSDMRNYPRFKPKISIYSEDSVYI
jgi:hypothetical protein